MGNLGLAMARVRFGDNGYDYFDAGNYVLFTADKTHKELFDYISKDLSKLPSLLREYIAKKMDIETFTLTDYQYTDNDSLKIKEILTSLHPYYEHEYEKVFINAIGSYLNTLLVYSNPKNTYDEEWYLKRFKGLAKPFLKSRDINPKIFYDKYKIWIDGHNNKDKPNEDEETFIPNFPSKPPKEFKNELRTQRAVKNMLYWILDISASSIEEMTMPQRIWLYGNIFREAYSQADMKVAECLLFRPYFLYRSNHDHSHEVDDNQKMYDLFEQLYSLSYIDIDRKGVPSEKVNNLNCVIEYAKTISKAAVYEEYEIDNLHQLLYLEILSMIESNTKVRKCKHCDKYFVVTDRKRQYCDRIVKGKKTCRSIGRSHSYRKKMEAEYPLKIYNRAYKTHFARVKNETMSTKEFSEWTENAKEKLEKVRAGELDISEFEEWLKK